jgi:hypothetical protein
MAKAEKLKSKKKFDKDQAERFKETARQLDADTTIERFEHVFKKIVPPKAKAQAQ